jgi:hypothetical protein
MFFLVVFAQVVGIICFHAEVEYKTKRSSSIGTIVQNCNQRAIKHNADTFFLTCFITNLILTFGLHLEPGSQIIVENRKPFCMLKFLSNLYRKPM